MLRHTYIIFLWSDCIFPQSTKTIYQNNHLCQDIVLTICIERYLKNCWCGSVLKNLYLFFTKLLSEKHSCDSWGVQTYWSTTSSNHFNVAHLCQNCETFVKVRKENEQADSLTADPCKAWLCKWTKIYEVRNYPLWCLKQIQIIKMALMI